MKNTFSSNWDVEIEFTPHESEISDKKYEWVDTPLGKMRTEKSRTYESIVQEFDFFTLLTQLHTNGLKEKGLTSTHTYRTDFGKVVLKLSSKSKKKYFLKFATIVIVLFCFIHYLFLLLN